ncbi:MAG TPA: hypothetical protein VNL98_06745 [Gemmatimonadales bacterium]|nr:hypothetical protein [Gemmatimonadales bacterium]
MISLCAWCQREGRETVIADDGERHDDPETGGVLISHGICAACQRQHFPTATRTDVGLRTETPRETHSR